jgi:chaperonin GroEL (HSP60 family)
MNSNIVACLSLAEILKTSFGPYGRDKLLVANNRIIISNDGATILKSLQVEHPAAALMVHMAMAQVVEFISKDTDFVQDDAVGDGTTSVVLLAAELLRRAQELMQGGISNFEITQVELTFVFQNHNLQWLGLQ